MSKQLKTFTKIISLILVVIMFIEASPTSALAALVADVQGDGAVVENYDESRNFYYDSHSIDVGRAGTLSLNDYTLTPSLSFDALGIDGNVLPVSVSMKYNPSEYRFLKDVMKYTPTAYGNGWLTNYNSMLCELENENTTQIAYNSGTGAVIVFEPDETDTSKWVLPETEDVYILKSADAGYTMYTDSATRVFDSYGRLISLVNTSDSATNTVQYVYNDGTNLEDIAKIIDGVGNEYRFTYTDGLLTKIKCYNSDGNAIIAGDGEKSVPLEMNFAYASGNLTAVTFPDGKTVSYGYNSADVMFRAVNIDGYKAEITFSDGFATKLAEFSPNGTEGGYVNITHNENTRTFTNDKGEVQVKTFDATGKIQTIVDGQGKYLYGAPEEDETIPEEDTSDYFIEEDTTDIYDSVCPCSECTEWECVCECESEDVCNCVQCKRYSDTTEDEHGNVLSEESFDGTKTMKSQNSYTSDGNYLSSSVDTSGNTVYYIYDEAGFMQSMTSGDTEVLFDYDAMGNLTRLYQQVSGLSNGTTMSNQYTYNNDRVASITHNGFTYNFTYDEWGNQTSVKINDRVYYSNEYSGENHDRLSKINYSNGHSVTYTYDSNNNIAGVSYDNGLTNAFAYEYDDNGELIKITDNDAGYITTYSNNGYEIRTFDNELMYSTVTNENGTVTENLFGSAITYSFNSEYNQITGKTTSSRSFSKYTSVVNDDYEAVENQIDYGSLVTTDWFGRISEKELNVDTINITDDILSEYSVSGQTIYTYADSETTATTKIFSQTSTFASDINTVSRTDFYDYDATGNITGIYRYVDGVKTYFYTYEYDEAGQLVRENLIEDNKTIIYLYDIGGNIVSKTVYAYTSGDITEEMIPIETTEFGYNYSECNDLLTDFTYTKTGSNDSTIDSYVENDYMGNVTRFNGIHFEWEAGRQLSRTYNNGDETRQFYNSDGMLIRIDSYVNGSLNEQMHYTWDGDRLISRTIENSSGKITSRIIYDAEGEAVGFIAEAPAVLDHDSVFLYRKNLQGDITGLIDEHGELWYEITYDAYGVHTLHIPGEPNNSLAQGIKAFVGLLLTPQLYRGYVYSIVGDMYTYYLGSRYYVPQFCRFFNADKHSDTQTGVLATNMFAYCNNNPVMYVDPTGEALELNIIVELINTFIELIRNIFSKNTNTIGTRRNPLELGDDVNEEVHAKSFWFEFTCNGAADITIFTSSTADIKIYKKGLIDKQIDTDYASLYYYLIDKYNNTNTYLIHVESANEITINCLACTYKDIFYADNSSVKWEMNDDSPKPIHNLYCMQKWYEPAESVGDLYTYISSSRILEFQSAIWNNSMGILDVAIQLTVSQSKLNGIAKVIAKAVSFFTDKLTIDMVEDLCAEIKNKGSFNGHSYENGIVISEYLWITEEIDETGATVYSSVTVFDVEVWDGMVAYGEGGYCGKWITDW